MTSFKNWNVSTTEKGSIDNTINAAKTLAKPGSRFCSHPDSKHSWPIERNQQVPRKCVADNPNDLQRLVLVRTPVYRRKAVNPT